MHLLPQLIIAFAAQDSGRNSIFVWRLSLSGWNSSSTSTIGELSVLSRCCSWATEPAWAKRQNVMQCSCCLNKPHNHQSSMPSMTSWATTFVRILFWAQDWAVSVPSLRLLSPTLDCATTFYIPPSHSLIASSTGHWLPCWDFPLVTPILSFNSRQRETLVWLWNGNLFRACIIPGG